MSRWATFLNDRVAKIRRGLVKAGYLDDPVKADEQGRDESFRKLASSVLTDLLHLGVLDYQVTVDGVRIGEQLSEFEVRQAVHELLKVIASRAADDFMAERNLRT